jgi:hypothetical protein
MKLDNLTKDQIIKIIEAKSEDSVVDLIEALKLVNAREKLSDLIQIIDKKPKIHRRQSHD